MDVEPAILFSAGVLAGQAVVFALFAEFSTPRPADTSVLDRFVAVMARAPSGAVIHPTVSQNTPTVRVSTPVSFHGLEIRCGGWVPESTTIFESLRVDGPISLPTIEEALEKQSRSLAYCYEFGRTRIVDLPPEVEVTMQVHPNGSAGEVRVTAHDGYPPDCIASRFRHLKLPSASAASTVSTHLRFMPVHR